MHCKYHSKPRYCSTGALPLPWIVSATNWTKRASIGLANRNVSRGIEQIGFPDSGFGSDLRRTWNHPAEYSGSGSLLTLTVNSLVPL